MSNGCEFTPVFKRFARGPGQETEWKCERKGSNQTTIGQEFSTLTTLSKGGEGDIMIERGTDAIIHSLDEHDRRIGQEPASKCK